MSGYTGAHSKGTGNSGKSTHGSHVAPRHAQHSAQGQEETFERASRPQRGGEDDWKDQGSGQEPRDGGRKGGRDGGRGGKDGRGGKRKRKGTALIVIGIVLLAIAAGILVYWGWGYIEAQMKYDEAREESKIDLSVFGDVISGLSDLADIEVDWDALKATNPDIVGWIYVEGTDINYPIAQADDNQYYLTHAFDGSYSSSGCIFLDSDSAPDMSSDCNFIYGHNMLNGSMFAQILQFQDQAVMNEGRRVVVLTPTTGFVLAPAFTIVCDANAEVRKTEFSSDADKEEYFDMLRGLAVSEASDIDIDEIDVMFNLATCSSSGNSTRTIVCCVPIEAVTF